MTEVMRICMISAGIRGSVAVFMPGKS